MRTSVLWHGTRSEGLELVAAVAHNYSCLITAQAVRLCACVPQQMLCSDQHAIDGLLFSRYPRHTCETKSPPAHARR